MQNYQRLVLISGMGGSGKTTALHTLEDLGFYCIDNLPLILLPNFLELLGPHPEIDRIAVGVDIRDRLFLDRAPAVIESLHASGQRPELLFLDADDAVLLRRYKETRRIHPLDSLGQDLEGAIDRERKVLETLAPYVDERLDSSQLTPHQLREAIQQRYGSGNAQSLRVCLHSFGFKRGILQDADLILDVRFLKNPYFVAELSAKTGLDQDVRDYVLSDPNASIFLDKTADLIGFLLPRYAAEGKRYLSIGIGCTGGQHRSVSLVEALYRRFERLPYAWQRRHRDLRKAVKGQ